MSFQVFFFGGIMTLNSLKRNRGRDSISLNAGSEIEEMGILPLSFTKTYPAGNRVSKGITCPNNIGSLPERERI